MIYPIELSIDNIFLGIKRITSIDLFSPTEFPSITYTITGTASARGRLHEAKLAWKITALLKREESNVFQAIYNCSEKKRRNFLNPSVNLVDRTQEFVEPIPRSRAIAPNSQESINAGLVTYYAIYNIVIINFKLNQEGIYFSTSFDMVETEKVMK